LNGKNILKTGAVTGFARLKLGLIGFVFPESESVVHFHIPL